MQSNRTGGQLHLLSLLLHHGRDVTVVGGVEVVPVLLHSCPLVEVLPQWQWHGQMRQSGRTAQCTWRQDELPWERLCTGNGTEVDEHDYGNVVVPANVCCLPATASLTLMAAAFAPQELPTKLN